MANERDIGFFDADSASDEDEIVDALEKYEVERVVGRRIVDDQVR